MRHQRAYTFAPVTQDMRNRLKTLILADQDLGNVDTVLPRLLCRDAPHGSPEALAARVPLARHR